MNKWRGKNAQMQQRLLIARDICKDVREHRPWSAVKKTKKETKRKRLETNPCPLAIPSNDTAAIINSIRRLAVVQRRLQVER